MREIKFRAWDTENKRWIIGEQPEQDELHIHWFDADSSPNQYKLDTWKHIKIMQYTGLKDKNGVEIYEGDILAADYLSADNSMGMLPNGWTFDKDDDRFTVVFDNDLAGWTFNIDTTPDQDIKDQFGEYAESYMHKYKNHARHILIGGIGEVIGNIYQNHELLA